MNTITRKIRLVIDDREQDVKSVFQKLYNWQEVVFRSYNFVATHQYILENLKEFFYFQDLGKLLLVKRSDKVPEGVLNTSRMNTTYQVLSKKFKGDIPMDILSNVNNRLVSTFNKERVEYFAGKRSLRTYKRMVPMPFSKKLLDKITIEDGQYYFTFFGITFKLFFGRDLSGNQLIVDRALEGEYKFCGSSVQLDGTNIFLLCTVQIPTKDNLVDPKKEALIKLDFNAPIKFIDKQGYKEIGSKEGYLHRRLAIKGALHRLQKGLIETKGGKGRAKKLQALDRFKKKEHNYVATALHKYSRQVIDLCIKKGIGTLHISGQEQEMKALSARIKEIKTDKSLSRAEKYELIERSKFVIPNWSYYGLMDKLKYKAKMAGIDVDFVKEETSDDSK